MDATRRPAFWKLIIDQRRRFYLPLGLRLADGSYLDTAGYTARAHVRATITDQTPLLAMTTANGRISVGLLGSGVDTSNLRIEVLSVVTGGLIDFGKGVWDLELIDPTGEGQVLLAGPAWLAKAATR